MENETLINIKKYAIDKLNNAYGYCGVAEGPGIIMLTSGDKKGNDIKITITISPE